MTEPDTIFIPWNEAAPTASVLDVAAVVALEQRIAEAGTSLLELMTRAGHAVAEAAVQLQPRDGAVVVLAGSGNNGGDGWVAAQDLADRGYAVTLVTKQAAPNLTADPARTAALRALEEPKRTAFAISEDPGQTALAAAITQADLIIDAILGTGFAHSQVRAPYDTWIQAANAARADEGARILAVDCPSGLNAQTGAAADQCIQADATVTMLAMKPGLLAPEAAAKTGQLLLAPLGVREA